MGKTMPETAKVHLAADQPCVACGYCEVTRCGTEASYNVTSNDDEVTCKRCAALAKKDKRGRLPGSPA